MLRKAFAELLERTGRAHDLIFTNEWEGRGPRGNPISVDGALIPPILRKPFGYWEAKDSKDDLDREIAAKQRSGYPDDNIIYEDTRTAILRQDGREVMRASLADDAELSALLAAFYAHEPPELSEFKAASAKFRENLPQVIEALRKDATVRAKFNTYRFADYKESMIALLAKVVRVSVETVAITEAMRAVPRAD